MKMEHSKADEVHNWTMASAGLPQWDQDEEVALADTELEDHDLVVFNDEVNTFEHVIATLVVVCGHSEQQAEQCTWIIHFKGKCSVKKGSYSQLVGMRNQIVERGISAEVV